MGGDHEAVGKVTAGVRATERIQGDQSIATCAAECRGGLKGWRPPRNPAGSATWPFAMTRKRSPGWAPRRGDRLQARHLIGWLRKFAPRHSLGAALATLTAYDIATKFSNAPIVTVVPEVEKSDNVLRIVNSDDPLQIAGVIKVDGDADDVVQKGTDHVAAAGMPSWLQWCMEDTQWVYAETSYSNHCSIDDVILVSGTNVGGEGVIKVNYKFAGSERNLRALKAHDEMRHLRILAGIDLPIGGSGRPDSVGSAFSLELTLYNPRDSLAVNSLFVVNHFAKTFTEVQYQPALVYAILKNLAGKEFKVLQNQCMPTANVLDRDYSLMCGASQSGDLIYSDEAFDGILGFGKSNLSMAPSWLHLENEHDSFGTNQPHYSVNMMAVEILSWQPDLKLRKIHDEYMTSLEGSSSIELKDEITGSVQLWCSLSVKWFSFDSTNGSNILPVTSSAAQSSIQLVNLVSIISFWYLGTKSVAFDCEKEDFKVLITAACGCQAVCLCAYFCIQNGLQRKYRTD
ncbi:hypothetical protein HAX54_024881 [Datura stramonium]|uniref:Uncharacterized protein n=1 Tax=Datura stramonium TaxID=4076 RepID=A0ABS8S684_DATST|nr:hypothetical protein [Datura stramonium]